MWEATTAKGMKIDLYCHWQRCKQLNALFNIMFFELICRRFLRYVVKMMMCVVITVS